MTDQPPQTEKKKTTFRLKKRIEDAQNYIRKPETRKTTILHNDSKSFLKYGGKIQYKTETEENEVVNRGIKKSQTLMLESKTPMIQYEVQGSQLKINKRFLSFLVKTGLVSTESIIVSNNGSTAIYYEWNRVEKNFLIPSSLRDNEERFFCHHVRKFILI